MPRVTSDIFSLLNKWAFFRNSCTFRSDFGADAFLELHSIVETAKKHDKTPYNAIQALFKV